MTPTIVNRQIDAPPARVFETIARVENFSKAVPHILSLEFLTEQHYGPGTRFRETRLMGSKQVSTELEVTQLDEGRHIRLVADAGGTIWDSLFEVAPKEGGTELLLTMEARPYEFWPRLLNPLMAGMVRRAVEADMDMVKAYCEA